MIYQIKDVSYSCSEYIFTESKTVQQSILYTTMTKVPKNSI